MDFALSAPIPWANPDVAQSATVHLGGTLEEIAAWRTGGIGRGEHPERPFVLLAQHSLFDPTRAPQGKHTVWAYCHVPNGSTVDMSARIEAQIERFAPGFRDLILAKTAAQYAGAGSLQPQLRRRRHQRRRAGLAPVIHPPDAAPQSLFHAAQRRLSLLVVYAARRRCAWHVWLSCRPLGNGMAALKAGSNWVILPALLPPFVIRAKFVVAMLQRDLVVISDRS